MMATWMPRTQINSSDEIGKLANTFNEMAAAVKSLNAELREQAIRDSLTGLFNRRYLDETLSRELAGPRAMVLTLPW